MQTIQSLLPGAKFRSQKYPYHRKVKKSRQRVISPGVGPGFFFFLFFYNCCLPLSGRNSNTNYTQSANLLQIPSSASPHLVNLPSHRVCTCSFCRGQLQLISHSQSCQLHRPQRSIYPGPEQSEPFADPFGEHHHFPFLIQQIFPNPLSEGLEYLSFDEAKPTPKGEFYSQRRSTHCLNGTCLFHSFIHSSIALNAIRLPNLY